MRKTMKKWDPQLRVTRPSVQYMDNPLLRHGSGQGLGYDGIGKLEVREDLAKDGSGPISFGLPRWIAVQGFVQARPTLHKADREGGGEPGCEALHGVAGNGGMVGDLVEAGVGAMEVAGRGVHGTFQEHLNEKNPSFFGVDGFKMVRG